LTYTLTFLVLHRIFHSAVENCRTTAKLADYVQWQF
jgi:hypothetical protein